MSCRVPGVAVAALGLEERKWADIQLGLHSSLMEAAMGLFARINRRLDVFVVIFGYHRHALSRLCDKLLTIPTYPPCDTVLRWPN